MALLNSLRQFYQLALLDIIPLCDLQRMYVRQTHDTELLSPYQLRIRIFTKWDLYAGSIRRWCNEVIDGEVIDDD